MDHSMASNAKIVDSTWDGIPLIVDRRTTNIASSCSCPASTEKGVFVNSIFLVTCLLAADVSPQALSYEGQLLQTERGQPAVAVKEFSARTVLEQLDSGAWQATTLVQEASTPLPWPEQFTTQQGGAAPAVIGYRHKDRAYVVSMMFPMLVSPEPLAEGVRWEVEQASFEVVGSRQLDGIDCWEVESVTGPARRHRILVRQDSPIVEELRQTVFMGQGDRFELLVRRTAQEAIPANAWKQQQQLQQQLRDLQVALDRNADDRAAPLTEQQVTVAAEKLPALVAAAEKSPYASYLARITRDQQERMQRADEVALLGEKFLGQPAPKITLTRLDGTEAPLAAQTGKVIVLHFWGYQDEPLEQPYGQIGYLDFLANRHRQEPVAVYGVAVDSRFTNPMTRDAGIRSVKRLINFMKLGYEVTIDTGAVLNQFGNPTRLGEELPLWIVIDRNGKIAHYHTGYYDIDNTRGLKELDELVSRLAKGE